jgi:tetratricopeptide (TPR) repeat protein
MKDLKRSVELSGEALELAEKASNPELLGRALFWHAWALALMDRYDESNATMDRAVDTARKAGLEGLEGVVRTKRAHFRHWQSAPSEEVFPEFEAAANLLRRVGDRISLSQNLNFMGMTLTERGDLIGAVRAGRAALIIDRELGTVSDFVLTNLGFAMGLTGDLKGAFDCYAEAEELATRQGHKFGLMRLKWSRALELVRIDREAAWKDLLGAEALALDIGVLSRAATIREHLARFSWLAGDPDEAIRQIDRGAAIASDDDPPGPAERAIRGSLKALALTEKSRFDEAEKITAEILASTGDKLAGSGMLGELLCAAHALALFGQGKANQAARYAAKARDLFEQRAARNPDGPWLPFRVRWTDDLITDKALKLVEGL